MGLVEATTGCFVGCVEGVTSPEKGSMTAVTGWVAQLFLLEMPPFLPERLVFKFIVAVREMLLEQFVFSSQSMNCFSIFSFSATTTL